MNWFNILKMMTPREFLEALGLEGDIKGGVGKGGTNMSLHHDTGYVKVRQKGGGKYFVSVDGKKNLEAYSLGELLQQVMSEIKKQESSYTDVLLREAGAVSTATPNIINLRYSHKKKEEDEDAE